MSITTRIVGPIQRELLPAPYLRRQFNFQQICKRRKGIPLVASISIQAFSVKAPSRDQKAD